MIKLSEKNALIISVLVIGVLVLLFYIFPYKSLKSTQSALQNEIGTLQNSYNVLSIDEAKKQEYLDGIEEAKRSIEDIEKKLPAGINQEMLLYLLTDIENKVGVIFPVVNFDPIEYLNIVEENGVRKFAPIEIKSDETQNTSVSENNQDTDKPEEASNSKFIEDTAVEAIVSTGTVLTYQQLKDLVNYIYSDQNGLAKDNRIVINSLQITSGDTDQLLTVAFSMNFYGLEYENRTPRSIDLGDHPPKNEGLFEPYDGLNDETVIIPKNTSLYIDESPDFYLNIDSTVADNMAMMFGKYDLVDGEVYLYADENAFVNAEIEITQAEGNYYFKYMLDGQKYPANYTEGQLFDPETAIEMKVKNVARLDEEDKSGVNLTINNQTDMPFHVVYDYEDPDYPRLNIVKTIGEVVIH